MGARLKPHALTPAQSQLLIVSTGTQKLHQISLGVGEQAGTNLTVRRQAGAGACIAERLRDRGDNTHTAQRLGTVSREARLIQGSTERVHLPQLSGGVAARLRHRTQNILSRQFLANLSGGNRALTGPTVISIQRHLLNETQLIAARQRPTQKLRSLIIIQTRHQHSINLDRPQASLRCTIDALEHGVELIAAGQLGKGLTANRIQRNIDAGQTSLRQRGGTLLQTNTVRRNSKRNIRMRLVDAGNNIHQIGAHQRLATGKADLLNAQLSNRNIGKARNLLGGEQILLREPL